MGMPGFEMGWMALGVALLLLALVILLKARQWQLASRLPEGEIVYSDMGTWMRQRKPLFDGYLGLTGRPDYLIEQDDGTIIPVEVKSSAAPQEPYYGHMMQLAAYCLLVQATYGLRPSHGIIQYRDKAFRVTFTPRMENDVLELLEIMRADAQAPDLGRDHENWRRCAGCGHLRHCGQALAPISAGGRSTGRVNVR